MQVYSLTVKCNLLDELVCQACEQTGIESSPNIVSTPTLEHTFLSKIERREVCACLSALPPISSFESTFMTPDKVTPLDATPPYYLTTYNRW
jgi:hypothetical protein